MGTMRQHDNGHRRAGGGMLPWANGTVGEGPCSGPRTTWCVLACAVLFAPGAVYGQSQPCVRPNRDCAAFWVTEVALGLSTAPTKRTPYVFGSEGGFLWNVQGVGLGATAFYALNEHGHRWGIRSRTRIWVSDAVFTDLGLGVIVNSGDDRVGVDARYPGLSGMVAIHHTRGVGAFVALERIDSDARTVTDGHVGLRVGDVPGAAGGLALLILAAWAESIKN